MTATWRRRCWAALWLALSSPAAAEVIISHNGAGDPNSGCWIRSPSGPNALEGPVFADHGYDAWTIDDNATDHGLFYRYVVPPQVIALGATVGWTLRARVRVVEDQDLGGSDAVSYRFGTTTWQWHFGVDPQGNPAALLWGPDLVFSFDDDDYHLFEITFDPAAQSATVAIDNVVVLAGYQGHPWGGNTDPGVFWGAFSGTNMGQTNFNLVEFTIEDPGTKSDCACVTADLNDDGAVSTGDLLILLAFWGPCGEVCLGDLNGDGTVSTADFLTLLSQWGCG